MRASEGCKWLGRKDPNLQPQPRARPALDWFVVACVTWPEPPANRRGLTSPRPEVAPPPLRARLMRRDLFADTLVAPESLFEPFGEHSRRHLGVQDQAGSVLAFGPFSDPCEIGQPAHGDPLQAEGPPYGGEAGVGEADDVEGMPRGGEVVHLRAAGRVVVDQHQHVEAQARGRLQLGQRHPRAAVTEGCNGQSVGAGGDASPGSPGGGTQIARGSRSAGRTTACGPMSLRWGVAPPFKEARRASTRCAWPSSWDARGEAKPPGMPGFQWKRGKSRLATAEVAS